MKDTRVITEDDVARATKLLEKYKSAKSAYERRVIADEEWWKMRAEPGREATGWLFNAIANKHADAMDNLPSPVVLPREETDTASATALSEIIPVILDAASFDRVYSEVWYDKLKHGTGCYGVFWDPERSHGKGDIAIEKIDILNLFWQGGVSDIQKSENLFYTSLWDNKKIKEKYPHVGELGGTPTLETSKYLSDETEEKEGKSVVVDWYYKRRVDGRDVLHLCKFCSGQLLYATENDERFKDGLYAHGKYPFFIDHLNYLIIIERDLIAFFADHFVYIRNNRFVKFFRNYIVKIFILIIKKRFARKRNKSQKYRRKDKYTDKQFQKSSHSYSPVLFFQTGPDTFLQITAILCVLTDLPLG